MEPIQFVVTAVIFIGVGYSFLRWFLTDDRRLNSELFG